YIPYRLFNHKFILSCKYIMIPDFLASVIDMVVISLFEVSGVLLILHTFFERFKCLLNIPLMATIFALVNSKGRSLPLLCREGASTVTSWARHRSLVFATAGVSSIRVTRA